MNNFFLIAIIVLIFLVIFQISKASEYVSLLKGEEKSKKQDNKLNGFLMISFLILGLIGVWWCNKLYYPLSTLDHGAASIEGKNIDTMIWMTIVITGIVFFITQILLFWFAFKYQHSDKRKALFYAHNNKLELIWTGIPAIVLTILVVYGLKYWFVFTSDAPKNAQVVEITGHQFGWEIHDVGLPAFRMKMDAVPGTPTTLWFTPIYTTTEMKVKTGNPDFVYEIACDQMCGKGHFTMRGVIEVVTPKEYKDYMIKLRPQYLKAKEFITQAPADSLKPIALDNHTH